MQPKAAYYERRYRSDACIRDLFADLARGLLPISARPKFRRSDIATRTKKGGAVLADELRGVWIDRIDTALVRINFYRFVFGGTRLASRLTPVCSKALQDFLRA